MNEIIQVLLADDDSEDCADFLDAFEGIKLKTKVHTVNDGAALIDYLSNTPILKPHLLFLDLNMPKLSGLECLIKIKKMPEYDNLTIVIYSTSSSINDIENTFLNGANIYLKKPMQMPALKKSLLHILTVNWQYQTSGLNRDNYLLNLE